jgi:hypothetical protein
LIFPPGPDGGAAVLITARADPCQQKNASQDKDNGIANDLFHNKAPLSVDNTLTAVMLRSSRVARNG